MIDREAKRLQKKAERDRRVEEVYGRYPEVAELDRQLRDVGVRLLKWAVSKAGEEEAGPLNAERAALARAREELLGRLNIALAVFEVQWDCPQCQDRGWIAFGEKCTCLVQEEIDGLFAASGLTGEMLAQTFATFDLSWYQGQSARLGEKMAQVLALGRDFADQVLRGVSRQNLLFYGGVGTGKTHLSSAIANHLLAKGKTVVYRTIGQIITGIYTAKFDFQNQGRQPAVITGLRQADLVIIDDLGSEKTTEFVATELFELVNDRLRLGLPLLVSTNLSLAELPARYGLRTADRLITGSICVEFEGTSIRQLKAVLN